MVPGVSMAEENKTQLAIHFPENHSSNNSGMRSTLYEVSAGQGYLKGRTNGSTLPVGAVASRKKRHFNQVVKAGGVGEAGVFSGFAKTVWCTVGAAGDLMWLECKH